MTKPKYRPPSEPSGAKRDPGQPQIRPQDRVERRLVFLESTVRHLVDEITRLWEVQGGPPSKKGGKR